MKRCKAEYLFKGDSPQIFVKAYLQKIIRIIRGNVYHAYIACIWMDISLSSGRL